MPRSSFSWISPSSGGNDELLNMVARLSFRQEDALAQLGLDKSYMFFLQCGRGSIMPSMLAKARDWNTLKQNGNASAPLRSTLFLHCFQELAQRALKLNLEANDDALIQNLKSKGILTGELKWAYLSWDPQAQILKPNKIPPLTSEEVRTLTELFQHLQKLSGFGITQLILLRVRPANLHRSPLANAISQRLRR